MQPQQVERVSVFRPPEYNIRPLWKAEVTESMINRYRMKVDALSYSEQRLSFSFRSPGVGVLLSSNVFCEMQFDVSFPGRSNFKTQMGPVIQRLNPTDILASGANAVAQPGAKVLGFAPKLCYSDGDAFGSCMTNYQVVVNGASLSNARINEYKAVLDRCWYADDVFQKRFHGCGGLPDQYDSVCVSGISYTRTGNADGRDDGMVNAYTGDSGIQKRCENLLACTVGLPDSTAEIPAAERDRRTIRVRFPLNGTGIFTPCAAVGDEMADSNPHRNSCIALPHMNVVSIDILCKDMTECIFRNLSSRLAGDDNDIANGNTQGGIIVKLAEGHVPQLHLEYLRLGAWNQIPQSVDLQCFRISVHDTTSRVNVGTVDIPAALTRSSVNRTLQHALPCIGTDRSVGDHAQTAHFSEGKYIEAIWSGVVTAQCPSYLCFVMQKSSEQYVLGGADADDAVGKEVRSLAENPLVNDTPRRGLISGGETYFLSRNTNASCVPADFELEIQSSIGAYKYAGDAFPFIRTQAELFRDHQRYCTPSYLGGDIQKWKKVGCLLLGADSYIRGLTTDGCAYPLNINAKVRFVNQRQYFDGTAAVGVSAAALLEGVAIQQDLIYAKPLMLQIYPKSSLSVSPSSAILSSQNLSHASGMDLISRKAQ